ncbi:MAG: hypothetical protein LBG58_06655 [Planctomycetaceae bacterium]|nr:hypothetical protein [Planctomycetaceae bacterium]
MITQQSFICEPKELFLPVKQRLRILLHGGVLRSLLVQTMNPTVRIVKTVLRSRWRHYKLPVISIHGKLPILLPTGLMEQVINLLLEKNIFRRIILVSVSKMLLQAVWCQVPDIVQGGKSRL